jgi:hypothetical protein
MKKSQTQESDSGSLSRKVRRRNLTVKELNEVSPLPLCPFASYDDDKYFRRHSQLVFHGSCAT